MSQIYEHENQMIIRFPKEVARKLREQMSKGDPSKPQVIQIQPVLEKSESLVDSIDSRTETKTQQIKETYTQRFEIDIPFLQYKGLGNLVELPTVTESYKTKDQINLFKSNDINQMIWIESQQEKMQGVRKVFEQNPVTGLCHSKLVCDHGLTPQTYDIRKECHRKQPLIAKSEVQRIESELDEIQKQFMQQGQPEDGDDSMIEQKKRQRKRYNKF